MLIAAALAILVVLAVPALALAAEDSGPADDLAELLGFEDAEALAGFLGFTTVQEEPTEAVNSNAADEFAESLGFDDAEELAEFLGLEGGEDELAQLLADSNNDPEELAELLGFDNENELAEFLGLESEDELAAALDHVPGEEDPVPGEEELAPGEEPAEGLYSGSEQEAESGDINQSFDVSNKGDNSNQCVGIQGAANTGNAQSATEVVQSGSEAGDVEFDDSGASIEVNGSSSTRCVQEVNQAASASG